MRINPYPTILLAAAAVVGVGAQSPPSARATSTAAADRVQFDVTVLDEHHQPVRGLSASDFTVLENGKPQPVVTVTRIDMPDRVAAAARTGGDVVSDGKAERRLVILMDDAGTDIDPAALKSAAQVARTVIDQLGPSDLAAVVFTSQGWVQDFTSARARLGAAIGAFVPQSGASPAVLASGGTLGPMGIGSPIACSSKRCDLVTLTRVAEALSEAPSGRKLLFYISSGHGLEYAVGREAKPEQATSNLFRLLQRASVTVNAFSASGLQSVAATAQSRRSPIDDVAEPRYGPGSTIDSRRALQSFAERTGGRAFFNTNMAQEGVQAVFRENSSYYLISFQPVDTQADGRFRKIQVTVNRPNVEVRTRNGYYAPTRDRN